ncbi:UMP kinase [Candidatus Marinamargulisbacteria bacterium SCGC AG-343-D04]|nr:UMP kinase [Candidatus Marinamargulisbacteria bacterium SCGC AG-343-D04]
MKDPKYKRILLKLSGEAFKGNREYGIDPKFIQYVANEIKIAHSIGAQIAIVIGGGNIFRGLSASENGMDRVSADYTGMLATIMNALALKDSLKKINIDSRVQSALEIKVLAEPFILTKAIRHLEKNRIVIFAGGTGNPFFTTDTTAALRAAEINADAIFKATKVDGVYDSDPMKNKNASKFNHIEYIDVLNKHLKVMDSTALSLSMDNEIPIIVFNINKKESIANAIKGKNIGTQIGGTNNE